MGQGCQTPPNIAELRAAGKCFKCREPWVPGHTKVCKAKQMYLVIVMENAEGKEEIGVILDNEEEAEPEYFDAEHIPVMQLSNNALLGTVHPTNTFTLQVQLGKHVATALVDTGSDASFVNAKFAIRAKLPTANVQTVKVIAANGRDMISNTACVNCPYTIQEHSFKSDFRLLEIQGYDIILGVDWVYTHSPVGLNLKTRELSITKDGQNIITFAADYKPPKHIIISPKKMCQLIKRKATVAVLVLKTDKDHSKLVSSPSPPSEIEALLKEFEDIFQEPQHLPPPRSIDHAITLIDESKMVNQRPYRLPFHQKNAMEELIKHMLESHMIRPNISPFSSPVILVKKKDGSWRMCVDYRQLNENTIKNKYPIPIIEDLLNELYGAAIFSKIDLRSGYHQIRMKDSDIHKTTFTTHLGHFEYVVLPFGLTNAPATFQSLMNSVLANFLRKFALVFFDDILIYSPTLAEHVLHLKEVLLVLRQHQLYAKLNKCTFGQPSIEYLGHVISSEGVATDPTKISIIQQWPQPTTVTQLRAFLGPTGYYRRFIQGYGVICRPLFNALKKDAFILTPEQENAFQQLKQLMSNPPVLALRDFTQAFFLEADASSTEIGAVLMQKGRPIAFFSKTLGPKALAASTYEKEAMAILEALKKWKHYFASTALIIRTDQQSLKYIHDQRLLEGIQHKLLIKLLGFNYTVEYKQGRTNKVADALSRATHSNSVMAISSVVPQWMAQVIKSYEQDIKCSDLITKLSIDPRAILNFSLSQGLLIYNGKLVIGDNGELKQHLLQSLHSSALGGHSGERATYQRIKLHFYWPKLKQHVTEFVKTCAVC